jgi:decaprenyl-phosphate phosphoribosyltransferase
VAGGLAAHVALSNWFLIVTSFGSLLIVTGKRSGEKQLLDEHRTDGDTVRQTLGMYSASFLRTVRTLTAAVTVTAYCLWAFERAAELHPARDPIWFQLTIVPFTIAVLHVLRLLDSGEGSTPEELSWVALFAIGIYS